MLTLNAQKLVLTAEHATNEQLKNLNNQEKRLLNSACRYVQFQTHDLSRAQLNNITILNEKLATRTIVQKPSSCFDHGLLHLIRSLFKGIGNLFHIRMGTQQLVEKVQATMDYSLKPLNEQISYEDFRVLIQDCINGFLRFANPSDDEISHFKYSLNVIEEFYIKSLLDNDDDDNDDHIDAAGLLQNAYIDAIDKNAFFAQAFNENDLSLQERVARIRGYNNPPPPPPMPLNLDPISFQPKPDLSSPAISNISNESIDEVMLCTMTYEPYEDAVIFIEEGQTYSLKWIESYLKIEDAKVENSNQKRLDQQRDGVKLDDPYVAFTPFRNPLTTVTLMPNPVVLKKKSEIVCPLTKLPYTQPFYCVEDHQTYDLDAILQYLKDSIAEQNVPSGVFISPVTGKRFASLTLYPNRVLFNEDAVIPPQTAVKGILTR